MKSFREFILEMSAADIPKTDPGYGGGMLSADIDARSDLTPEQRKKLKARTLRRDRVSSDTFRSQEKPSSNTPKSSSPPKTGAVVPSKSGELSTNVKPPVQKIKTNLNVPGGKKIPGLKGGSVLSGVIDTAAEKSSGSGWARSLAKGTASALGALGGGALGSAAGPVGTFAGGAAGSMAAGKAFDTVAGKNAVQRAADREANRKRQSGGELKGIGGKTTFSKAKDGTGFMSTGSGSQRKTVQLAKTSVVKDPKTGKAETGYLAMKDGKAIYKRGANPGEGSSNAFERIGRTFNPNAYKANDAKLAAAKLKTAATSDIKRQQALGVKGSQNLVGPKIVGPQKPTPKPSAGIRSSGTSPGSIKIK